MTGATGQNGGEVVKRLSARGVPVRALVRSAEKAGALASLPQVEVVAGDMARPETLGPALRGVTRAMLISSSVPAMLEVQLSFVEAAKKAGVPHVVKLSGIMPELDSPFRFARMHAEIERGMEAAGVGFTMLRAGEFMHSYFRQVPTLVAKGTLFLPMAQARIASIDIGDIADAAVATLTQPGHEGKIYRLTGPEALTMGEVAERLSRAIGKPIRYVDVSPEDARKARLAAGMPEYLADGLDELFAERRRGKEGTVFTDLRDVFGIRPTTFEEFAQRYAPIFRGEQPPPKV
ncbi:MAG TPA: SDR family oxidoreductase [Myxococcaceae bacterium]|nr:SDR family oxidoreductase [Myxococcaceae bacterium]